MAAYRAAPAGKQKKLPTPPMLQPRAQTPKATPAKAPPMLSPKAPKPSLPNPGMPQPAIPAPSGPVFSTNPPGQGPGLLQPAIKPVIGTWPTPDGKAPIAGTPEQPRSGGQPATWSPDAFYPAVMVQDPAGGMIDYAAYIKKYGKTPESLSSGPISAPAPAPAAPRPGLANAPLGGFGGGMGSSRPGTARSVPRAGVGAGGGGGVGRGAELSYQDRAARGIAAGQGSVGGNGRVQAPGITAPTVPVPNPIPELPITATPVPELPVSGDPTVPSAPWTNPMLPPAGDNPYTGGLGNDPFITGAGASQFGAAADTTNWLDTPAIGGPGGYIESNPQVAIDMMLANQFQIGPNDNSQFGQFMKGQAPNIISGFNVARAKDPTLTLQKYLTTFGTAQDWWRRFQSLTPEQRGINVTANTGAVRTIQEI